MNSVTLYADDRQVGIRTDLTVEEALDWAAQTTVVFTTIAFTGDWLGWNFDCYEVPRGTTAAEYTKQVEDLRRWSLQEAAAANHDLAMEVGMAVGIHAYNDVMGW